MGKIKNHKTKFLDSLKHKNRTDKTLQNYDLYLDRFIQQTDCSKSKQITKKEVKEFKSWLKKYRDKYGEKIAANTKNYHLIALRSFFRFLKKQNQEVPNPNEIKLIESPKRKLNIIKQKDIERILKSPINDNNNKSLSSFRDRTLIGFFLTTGMRISEVTSLKQEQINLRKNKVIISKPQTRSVYMSDSTKKWAEKYLDERSDKNNFLFISHDNRTKGTGNPISDRSVQRLVKKHKRAASIPYKITPSILRNTCIVNLLKNDVNLETVKQLAGHESIAATKVFNLAAEQKVENKYNVYRDCFEDLIKKLTKQ